MALHSMCHPGYPLPHGESQSIAWCSNFDRVNQRTKSAGFFFPSSTVDPRPRLQLLLVEQRELPVVGELADVEVHVPTRDVGEPPGLDAGDQVYHVLDVLGGPADDGGHGAAEKLEIAEERLGVELRDLPHGGSLLAGALQHLVLALVGVTGEVTDIRDVHDVADRVAEVFQRPTGKVLEEVGAEVADVRVVVHREPAAVHPDFLFLDRREHLQLAAHRVPQLQFHVRHLLTRTGYASRPPVHRPLLFRA